MELELSVVGSRESPNTNVRSRERSLLSLPQHERGITLRNLWELYNSHKDWLEKVAWTCSDCQFRSGRECGPCTSCGSSFGYLRRPNLYDVHREVILPTCSDSRISYAEMLFRKDGGAQSFDSFVSHWWGEEFSALVHTLDRYAQSRCSDALPLRSFIISYSLACVVYMFLYSFVFLRQDAFLWAIIFSYGDAWFWLNPFNPVAYHSTYVLLLPAILTAFLVAVIVKFRRRRNPLDWRFWICAFANNQFALQHAIDPSGDIMLSSFAMALRAESCKEVVAVFDANGFIYTRIWCAFELFFVSVLLPRKFRRSLAIVLANAHGIISDGDVDQHTLAIVSRVVQDVQVATAQASKDQDKISIQIAMESEGTDPSDLDEVLRGLARGGVFAERFRRIALLILFCMAPLISALAEATWYFHFSYNLEASFYTRRLHLVETFDHESVLPYIRVASPFLAVSAYSELLCCSILTMSRPMPK